MQFFLLITASGIATGAIYGLIAVGYSLTYSTTRILNFALGMWVMIGGMLSYSLIVSAGLPPVVVLPIVMIGLFFLGIIAERISVYPFIRAGSDVWVMSTLAIGLLFIDFAELIWGRSPTPVPPYVGKDPIHLGPIIILPQQILMLVTVVLLFLLLQLFYSRTLVGKAFKAVSQNPETASLMGINTRLVQIMSYAIACALAGLGGFMVVPLTLAEPQLGTVLGLKAFAIAIIAGLGAPGGILFCGLAYGAMEGLISGYLNTGVRDIVGFSLMIVVLYFRPEGLFSSIQRERA